MNLLETLKPRFLRSATHVRRQPAAVAETDRSGMADDAAIARPQRHSLINKPLREIAVDLTIFVIGVVILYGVDLTVISHGAPIAFQYLLQFFLYLNRHAVTAVQTLY